MPARTTHGTLTASRRLRRLMALVSSTLLAVIGLCALAHGPSSDDRRSPTPSAVPTSTPIAPATTVAVAGDEAPHGSHRHHGGDECAADGALRTTTAVAEQPPAATGALPLSGVLTTVRRRPCRLCGRRRARTGRMALVRTSRWRI
ncbi:hypothetical protein [Streptomyces bluensis]|uniref:Secreted protein n=1 Tax=Streptomyces bluensis TaxID=33897 RepID=A0ABW6UV10_9ACTN